LGQGQLQQHRQAIERSIPPTDGGPFKPIRVGGNRGEQASVQLSIREVTESHQVQTVGDAKP
jgi:hypothetical protein